MYKMEVKLLGLKFRVEVVLLCILLGWILGAHLFCSCVRVTPYEGFELLKNTAETMTNKLLNGASILDYKMSAGIEVKKNPDLEVQGFMKDFQNTHEAVGMSSSCSA